MLSVKSDTLNADIKQGTLTDKSLDPSNDELNLIIKKKKGRPRKNHDDEVVINDASNVEKKKRGRKKKEKTDEEPKIKKKRGRKAVLKYFSSSIRRKIPLTSTIHDYDKSILHLDIKENREEEKKRMTYDTLNADIKVYQDTLSAKQYASSVKDTLSTNASGVKGAFINQQEKVNFDKKKIFLKGSKIIDLGENNLTAYSLDNDDILCEYIENNENITENITVEKLYEKRLESRKKQDALLIEQLDKNDEKLFEKLSLKINEDEAKNNSDTVFKNGLYRILENYIKEFDWVTQIDIPCWWCCHTFNSIPIGCPVDYNKKLLKFRVKGIFCSFACMLAYVENENKSVANEKTKSLITFMYKKLTGIDCKGVGTNNYKDALYNNQKFIELFGNDDNLKEQYINCLLSFIDEPLKKAPSKYHLQMFGGHLTIDEFRSASKEHKIYKMIEYPMFISRDYIETVDIEKIKNINKTLFNNPIIIENNTDIKVKDAKERALIKTHQKVHSSLKSPEKKGINKFIKF